LGAPPFMWPALLSLISLPWAWFVLNRIASPMRAVRLRRVAQEKQGPGPQFTGRLTIGAYNIRHGLGAEPFSCKKLARPPRQELDNRVARLAALLAEIRPDLLVLNEVDFASCRTYHQNQAAYLAEKAGFPFWVEQTNVDAALFFWRHRYGNALLSRYPLADLHLVRLPGHNWWEPVCWGKKEGLLCSVYPSPEIPLKILGIHLDHRQETTRLKSVQVIHQLRRASPGPLILAGDFNSSPAHYPLATPDPSGQTALSWLLAQGGYQTRPQPAESPGPLDLTFSTSNPRQVIDWLLVPGDWHIHSHRIVDAGLSDHRLVLMEVEMPVGFGRRP
jgi:endonuclease/exonuclease/phosphatase family metal-dependent hydrolase